ncbi:MAG: DinB family protein [Treponema sp.]|jgi:uncharacterized damage-inducible protein DinB|nr:DinB family protein [Treponema sp.]
MQVDTVKILAAYNWAANAKMNEFITNLNTAEWNKALGGYFPSVRSLCSHIYIADITWLKRFSAIREFSALKNSLFSRDYSFKEVLFPTIAEYRDARSTLDEVITGFTNELSDADLAKDLEYSNSAGDKFTKNMGGLFLHACNHGTHHRGMISLYLEILGRANDFNSLSAVLPG